MALINHRSREIHFKLVYYGPGLGGKTTNLKVLHDRLPPERRGRLISIATDHERTLFFDFLPIDIGTVNGLVTRFHLYTVPGQVYYRLSRRAVLQGVDGIVFVADSHPAREQSNVESLRDLDEHLSSQGLGIEQMRRIPRVFQYNKRDLPAALPIARLSAALNPAGAPEFEAIASTGQGVSETLRSACKLMLARLAGPVATAVPSPAVAPPALHSPGVASRASTSALPSSGGASRPSTPAVLNPGGASRASTPDAKPGGGAGAAGVDVRDAPPRTAPGATTAATAEQTSGRGPVGRAGASAPVATTLARPPAAPRPAPPSRT